VNGATKIGNPDQPVTQLTWTDELIQTFWDGVECTHLDDLSFGKLAGPKFLRLIREHLPAAAKICDFGAGGGHFAETLLQAGFATAIYEPSPRRSHALLKKLSGYDSFLGVIGADDGRLFDAVIMAEVIEHVPDRLLGETLNRVNGLLRDGGIVIVTTPNEENIGHAQVLCPVCRQVFHPWQHLRSFTHVSLENQLSSHGFRRRFLGLVDFSDDAAAIEYSRLFSPLFELMNLLKKELAEFSANLPLDHCDNSPSNWQAGSVYATDTLQFEHGLILAELAKLRAQSEARIRAIRWPAAADKFPAVLSQLCDEFYSRLHLLIGAQLKLAQMRDLTRRIGDIVGRFSSLDRAISDTGVSARPERWGLGSLHSSASKAHWAAKFCWEVLRRPALLVEVIRLPRILADYTRAISERGEVCEARAAGVVSREEPGGGAKLATNGASGAVEAVLVHLRSIAQRVEYALRACAPSSSRQLAGLGYDLYIGRGSNILYVGEKLGGDR
jgi:2-polyprenyl-3-methyl-5-hydroxy-6-metoxy-1,4-benzoquinol methylase